jgi:predicted TPR repeat methyltransferase
LITRCFPSWLRRAGQLFPVPLAARPLLSISAFRAKFGLREAAKRELYDELIEAELGAYLVAHPSAFDLIVACDTLVYHGRLDDVVAAAATALKPGGRMLFTLEQLADDGGNHPYRLAPTGRFCHRAAYVHATLARVGLVDTGTDAIVPRLECGEPVDGLLVTARTPAHAS